MALSDCIKCWETPCICGFDYIDRSIAYKYELAAAVLGVTEDEIREAFPNINSNQEEIKEKP